MRSFAGNSKIGDSHSFWAGLIMCMTGIRSNSRFLLSFALVLDRYGAEGIGWPYILLSWARGCSALAEQMWSYYMVSNSVSIWITLWRCEEFSSCIVSLSFQSLFEFFSELFTGLRWSTCSSSRSDGLQWAALVNYSSSFLSFFVVLSFYEVRLGDSLLHACMMYVVAIKNLRQS